MDDTKTRSSDISSACGSCTRTASETPSAIACGTSTWIHRGEPRSRWGAPCTCSRLRPRWCRYWRRLSWWPGPSRSCIPVG